MVRVFTLTESTYPLAPAIITESIATIRDEFSVVFNCTFLDGFTEVRFFRFFEKLVVSLKSEWNLISHKNSELHANYLTSSSFKMLF